jgi:hypothetical protein
VVADAAASVHESNTIPAVGVLDKVTAPSGALCSETPTSVTVTVQVVGEPAVMLSGAHDTTVSVDPTGSGALQVRSCAALLAVWIRLLDRVGSGR